MCKLQKYPPRKGFLKGLELDDPPTPKLKSFLFGGDNADADCELDDSLFATAACSGVPYFLGLPLFLLTPVSNGEETAEGAEL